MILASVTALLLGVAIGYLLGIRHQAKDEVIPDGERHYDDEALHLARWQSMDLPDDLEFYSSARLLDPQDETIHNIPLSRVLAQTSAFSKKAQRSADRIILPAIKVDKQTRKVTRVILNPGNTARKIAPLIRKSGIKVSIGAD